MWQVKEPTKSEVDFISSMVRDGNFEGFIYGLDQMLDVLVLNIIPGLPFNELPAFLQTWIGDAAYNGRLTELLMNVQKPPQDTGPR